MNTVPFNNQIYRVQWGVFYFSLVAGLLSKDVFLELFYVNYSVWANYEAWMPRYYTCTARERGLCMGFCAHDFKVPINIKTKNLWSRGWVGFRKDK